MSENCIFQMEMVPPQIISKLKLLSKMKKTRNSLLTIVITLLIVTQSIAQKEISTLLEKQYLKLNEVEYYLKNNHITPLECVEDSNDSLQPSLKRTSSHRGAEGNYVFNVYFHILNQNNGERAIPITEGDILQAVANLNKAFNQFKIFFKYNGYGEINNTWRSVVYLGGDRTFNQLVNYAKSINKYKHDSFNVFIASAIRKSQYDSTGIAGVGNKPGINTLIDDEYLLTSTLPHEIGHNFYLHHTHHNWNSSNCTLVSKNDMVEDTMPSVPFSTHDVENDCSTYKGEHDEIGCDVSIEEVPANNFMSSNVMPCRSLGNAIFTPGQGKRMRESIQRLVTPLYLNIQNSIESLYEPYAGSYTTGNNEVHYSSVESKLRFQKGFDYQFVNCENTNQVVESFSKEEIPNKHPAYTAIKILQVSRTEALKCNIPEVYKDNKVISFGTSIFTNYTIQNHENYDEEAVLGKLSNGYHLVVTKNTRGQEIRRMIYKSR